MKKKKLDGSLEDSSKRGVFIVLLLRLRLVGFSRVSRVVELVVLRLGLGLGLGN